MQCTINLDDHGIHHGNLRIPYSSNVSAYGMVHIPITSIRNGEGPTVLLVGGNHGDEYEGQVLLHQLAHSINLSDVTGQLILLPQANAPATRSGTRNSPIDQGNLNRAFPGDAKGSITQQIAHLIESQLLPIADYALDIHSGGRSLAYTTTLMIRQCLDSASNERNQQLFSNIGAEFLLCYPENPQGYFFTSAATRLDVLAATLEVGGGATLTAASLAQGEMITLNFLQNTGVLKSSPVPHATSPSIEGHVETQLFCEQPGWFVPHKVAGDSIAKNEELGYLRSCHAPAQHITLRAPYAGHVLCHRAMTLCDTGDCLFQLMKPILKC